MNLLDCVNLLKPNEVVSWWKQTTVKYMAVCGQAQCFNIINYKWF